MVHIWSSTVPLHNLRYRNPQIMNMRWAAIVDVTSPVRKCPSDERQERYFGQHCERLDSEKEKKMVATYLHDFQTI